MKKMRLVSHALRLVRENVTFLVVIFTTFLALALIVLLTFGSFYQRDRDNAIAIGNMTVALEAQRIEDALNSGINTLLVSGYTVDTLLERGAAADEIEAYLVQETQGVISGIDPEFSGLYGVIKGEYVDGVGWQPEQGYDPYTRPWYLAAAEQNGELAIVSPYIDAQTGSIMVSFSKILCDGESAISFDMRLDGIYEVTKTIQLNGKGYCFLTDKKGQVIAHRDNTQVGKNYLLDAEFDGSPMRELLQRIDEASQQSTTPDTWFEGDNHMAFTSGVRGSWNVVLMVENNDIFENIRATLMRNIAISLALFILVGYFCTSNYRNKKRAIRYAEDIRTDTLTGLNNRGEFDRYLHTTLSSISLEKQLYLLLLDADRFKLINDNFGHQEGDRALRLIAAALKRVCRDSDSFCARYGGDEFVIVCKCDDENTVKQLIADVDKALQATMEEHRLPYTLAVSCGYACYDDTTPTLTDLVDKADSDLYRVKAQRRRSQT